MDNPSFTAVETLAETLPNAETLAWLLFFLIVLYTAVHAGVFAYHWYAYNITPKRFFKYTVIVYFVGIFAFIGTLFLATIAITS